MKYEDQLKLTNLYNTIVENITATVSAVEFINYYINHTKKETIEKYNLVGDKPLRKILEKFNYDFSTIKPSAFKGKKAARSHESYIAGGKKSAETQVQHWQEKPEEEKKAWSEMQKEAHSSEDYRQLRSQLTVIQWETATKEEIEATNKKRSETLIRKMPEIKARCMEKYGVAGGGGTREAKIKAAKTMAKAVAEDGTHFDSGWELKVYNYTKSKGYIIERQLPIKYGDKVTYIDFKINGQYYEVKGSHLLNETYKDFDMQDKLKLYAENNVIVITDIERIKEINPDIKYININDLTF